MSSFNGFLGLPDNLTDEESARVIVVPLPIELTTSYGKGTYYGPQAIIEASCQVELWDEKLQCEPSEMGIFTDSLISISGTWDQTASALREKAADIVSRNKFPLFLGGEHSVTAPLVEGIKEHYPDLSVLHLDAHADLRDSYEDLSYSHASVMRRIYEQNIPFCSVAVRSFSQEEFHFMKENNLNICFAHQMHDDDHWMDMTIEKLSDTVYVTFDIDAIDISEVRSTGTPEPGGMVWKQVIKFLEKLSKSGKHFIGADLVELSPSTYDHASSFYAARLAYKLISYLAKK